MPPLSPVVVAALVLVFTTLTSRLQAAAIAFSGAAISASSSAASFSALGAVDGDRFSTNSAQSWQGAATATNWWWEAHFNKPQRIGAILQIAGDHDFVLRNAPREYVWQWSDDGFRWRDIASTRATNESRTFRLHRLDRAIKARWVRLKIDAASGAAPTLREVEFYSDPRDAVPFPDWIIVVNTTDDPRLPGHGTDFIPLAKSCRGWDKLQAQQVWLGSFNESYIKAEPRPLCAFLSGNFKDWCQIAREPWRGTQEVLKHKNLPMWASCGGAQGLAILSETGVDHPWDCPHCRDPKAPKTPIYTHIGHKTDGPHVCGDYSDCVFERGPHKIKQTVTDPAFHGLANEFTAIESHCGQIEYPPKGWHLIATAGSDSKTKTQCLRLDDRYIYAAQFHIEMAGVPDASRQIMGNFLGLAREWGGWNPKGKSVE